MADVREAYIDPEIALDIWRFGTNMDHTFTQQRNDIMYKYKRAHNLIRPLDRCRGCGKVRKEHSPWCYAYSGFPITNHIFIE